LVVVGAMGGAQRQEQLALGDTPNIAARIHGLAAPNTLVISETTHRLVQGYFTGEALGEHTLRGVAEPVTVYRVLGESGATSRLEVAHPRGLTPLVGRDAEVTLLQERWEQVKAGYGHVVLLTGEAGLGKSRLVQVLKDHVAHEPHMLWECRSVEYYQHTALFPLVDLFQRLLRFEAHETPDAKVEKLTHALRQYRLPVEETVPLFAPLLSLSLPESRYAPLHVSPQRQRRKTLETMVAILLELAEHQPVLFIVEDLHWSDPSTLELLNLVIDQTPTASLLVLLTCRPHFQPAWHHRSYLTEITVNRLSPAQVAQIVHRLTDGKTLPKEVLAQLVEKTDGVPLFVEEITKALLESGQLQALDRHYELGGSLSTLTIPATLHDSLMARLDHLVTAKAVAQYAAVIGRGFTYELFQAVSQFDEATLQRELRRLVDAELVYQRGIPPQAHYVFKHALIRDAAYESLLKSTRQRAHQRIAQVLEAQFPATAEMQPEVVAQHYTAAGLPAQALPFWQRAGQRAHERSALREGAVCFEQALGALKHLPESRTTQEQAIDLRLHLRNMLWPLGEIPQTLRYLREAETLANILGDQPRLGRVSAFLCRLLREIGEHHGAVESGQHALAVAETLGDFALQVMAQHFLGAAYHALGDHWRAIGLLRKNVEALVGDLVRERFGQSGPPAVLSRASLARCLAEVGAFPEGIVHGEEALRIAEMLDVPAAFPLACLNVGSLFLRRGDLARAIPVLERGLARGQALNTPLWFPETAAALGCAYAFAGRTAEAVSLLEQAEQQSTALGTMSGQTFWQGSASEAYQLAGHVEEAVQLVERTLTLARDHQERGHEAYALRLLGDIATWHEPSDLALAETHYDQALALAEELGMRPLQAHCHRGLGTLYATAGQREQARAALSTAIELYRAMEMTFWLPETEAVLAQVSTR
ncbi:MAG TPA: AAA family ATPase, partial [Candidatus Tectomicrobia bacterium]